MLLLQLRISDNRTNSPVHSDSDPLGNLNRFLTANPIRLREVGLTLSQATDLISVIWRQYSSLSSVAVADQTQHAFFSELLRRSRSSSPSAYSAAVRLVHDYLLEGCQRSISTGSSLSIGGEIFNAGRLTPSQRRYFSDPSHPERLLSEADRSQLAARDVLDYQSLFMRIYDNITRFTHPGLLEITDSISMLIQTNSQILRRIGVSTDAARSILTNVINDADRLAPANLPNEIARNFFTNLLPQISDSDNNRSEIVGLVERLFLLQLSKRPGLEADTSQILRASENYSRLITDLDRNIIYGSDFDSRYPTISSYLQDIFGTTTTRDRLEEAILINARSLRRIPGSNDSQLGRIPRRTPNY